MRLYRVRDSGGYWVRGRRAVYVPGVICDVCGNTWATADVTFPTVDFVPRGSLHPRAEPFEEFARIRDEIEAHVPALRGFVAPGTQRGRYTFERAPKRPPSTWHHLTVGWFVRDDLWASIGSPFGLTSVPVGASLGDRPAVVELALPYLGAQPDELRLPGVACARCRWRGSRGVGWHDTIVASSVPDGAHAFRFSEHTTIVLVSEALRDALAAYPRMPLAFDEVRVV